MKRTTQGITFLMLSLALPSALAQPNASRLDHPNEEKVREALQAAQALGTPEEIQAFINQKRNEHRLAQPNKPNAASRGRAAYIFISSYLSKKDHKQEFAGFSAEYISAMSQGGQISEADLEEIGEPILALKEVMQQKADNHFRTHCNVLTNDAIPDKVAIQRTMRDEANPLEDRTPVYEHALNRLISALPADSGKVLQEKFDDFAPNVFEGTNTMDEESYLSSIAHIIRPLAKVACYTRLDSKRDTKEGASK